MATRRLNPVSWSEGMFLRPHHLQQRDLFEAERLRYHLRTLDPFHWGVRELVLDEEALADHRVAVQRLEAVLPGGTVIRYPQNAVLEPRDFDPQTQRLEVHVGLRHLNPSKANAARAEEASAEARERIQSEEVPDLQRGGFESAVDFAYPNLRLFLSGEEEELDRYDSFKLLEIEGSGELKRPFALSPGYCPPLLALQGFPPLYEAVARTVSQIASRVRVLAGRTATVAIADLPRMWMRYTLARTAPVLRHHLATGETRPYDLYTALVEAAGALAAFQRDEPVELPAYDHANLAGCFGELLAFIEAQLGEAVPERFHELPMAFDAQKSCYVTTDLNVERVDPRNLYFLGVKAPVDSEELVRLVVDQGKASSKEGVTPLVLLNTKGLRIEHLPAAPTEIAARAGYEYFRLEPHGPQWGKVREEFSLALHLGKLENADVRLYVVAPESEG